MARIVVLLLASMATLSSVAADPAGRWSGAAHLPGREIPIVLDLAKDPSGAWVGSIIVPGFYVKGAPLGNIEVTGDDLSFDAGDALGAAPNNATFVAHLDPAAGMTGQIRQAGNVGAFRAQAHGRAQVESRRAQHRGLARDRGPLDRRIRDGRLPSPCHGGHRQPRGFSGDVEFVVVGKATTKLPDRLRRRGRRDAAHRVARLSESRSKAASTDPTAASPARRNGPFELPLILRRRRKDIMKTASSRRPRSFAAASRARAAPNPMFRGDAAHAASTRRRVRAQFHGVSGSSPPATASSRRRSLQGMASSSAATTATSTPSTPRRPPALEAHDRRRRCRRPPPIAGDTLYVGSYDGKFYALDRRTGAPRWKFATGGERRFEAKGLHGMQPKNQTFADPFDMFLSSPVVADGVVYFGSGDGNVYALDAAPGDLRWKFRTGDVVHASPAYADGVVYVGSWDSYFYALDARTGTEKMALPRAARTR